jgi:hypothetical protein
MTTSMFDKKLNLFSSFKVFPHETISSRYQLPINFENIDRLCSACFRICCKSDDGVRFVIFYHHESLIQFFLSSTSHFDKK